VGQVAGHKIRIWIRIYKKYVLLRNLDNLPDFVKIAKHHSMRDREAIRAHPHATHGSSVTAMSGSVREIAGGAGIKKPA
jgi:hypothetical protein